MPQQIEIPGQGVLEFPDEFSDDQIKAIIKRKFPQQPPTLPDPRQATALEVPQADLFPTQFQSEAQVPSTLTYAALDKQAAPEVPQETSTLREFGKEFTQIPPEIKQRAREMTERTQRLMQELGPEEYRQKVHDVATRFDAAIKQIDPDSEGAAERRDKLWQMRTAALEELGVDTLRANELPKLSREQAATLIGPQHPRLANILSTGQQIASGLAEGFLESPGMFTKGAGPAIGKAFVGTMTVDIGKNLVLAEEAYRKGDVEAGDSYLAQAGGTAALMGIPHAAAKFDTLRAEANQIRDRARAQAWALSFGAGGPPAETAMVRTSQKVLQPDQPETVLLREVRPTPPVEPGPLRPITPPPEPGESEQDYAIRIGREREHIGTAPGTVVPPEPAQVRETESGQDRGGGGPERSAAESTPPPTPTAPVGQQALPPVPKGQQIIQIERPDGSRYTALYAGYLDVPGFPLHKRMQVGRVQGDRWGHGFLQPDEKVVDSTGPIPTFDEWKAQQAPKPEPSFQPPDHPDLERGLKTKEERKAAFDKWRQEQGEWAKQLQSWEAAQPPDKPIIFESEGMIHAITPNIGGGWRTTAFVKKDRMAWGHEVFKTRYEAVRDRVMQGDKRIEEMPFEVEPSNQFTSANLPEPAAEPTVPPAAEPAATITAPEVQKGTGMAAEAGATPAPTAPAAPPEPVDLPSLIDKAMAIVRTKQLDPQERSALAQHIETARKGNPAPLIDITEKLSKNPDKPRKQRVARGVPGVSRFDRETEVSGPDILSWVKDNMKLLSRSAARKVWGREKYDLNKSLWDDAPTEMSGGVHHNVIYSPEGFAPDRVAQAAFNDGVLKEPSVNALWQAIDSASKKRKATVQTEAREAEFVKQDIKAHEDWVEATKKAAKDDIEVTTEDLSVGDLLEVDGERVEVTARDEDGTLTLKDGRKFGTQTLPEGKKIYVEKFEQQPAEGEAEFLPKEEKPPTPPAPTLRPGEKAGELFQAADQPFNLAGQQGIDAERLAKEKAETDRKAAEKKAFDEAHAQEFPKKEEAGPPLARAIEIEKKFGLGPADAHFFNVALDAVAAAPEKWTTLAEGVQKEAMRAAIAAGGELSKTGDLQLAKRIASEYLTEAPPPKPEEGKAPDGTRIRNFVKDGGKWWRIQEDGTRYKLPANRPTSRKLEAEAALPPAPPETRTPIQIIDQAKQIRVKLPEGATVLRAYDSKGRKSDHFIADLNKGDNVLRASDIVRIEAGIKNKKGEFQKVEGEIQVSEYKPGAIDKAIAALNAAKVKKIKDAGSGDLHVQLIPGVTFADFQRIWNKAMDIGIAALKAGKTIQEAIEAAIEHLRSAAISYGSSFDENMARQRLKQVMEPGPTGAMIRTPEELAKQKEFGVKPAVRTVGAYSDIARLKDQEAQALGLSDRARRLLSLPNQMELAARGLSESAGIENYKEASAAVENATPDVKWGVVRDALHSMGFEQRRSIKLKEMYEKQRALVSSPGFQNKMSRLAQREWEAEVRTQKEETFKNVLAVKAAEFLAKLEQKKADDAESEMLRDNLKQARQLQDYALAVGMEMDNIVSVVYPNYWEFGRSNKNGKDFTTLYLAVKAGQGEPVTDPQRLALVRLAAEVLAINDNLTTRLVWLEQMKQEPDFAQAVSDFGKAFSKRMAQDPARAIKELVEKQAGLSKRAEQARRAFRDLNRAAMRDVEKYSDLESAWQVDERVKASDEWKNLVNQVYSDAKALRIPDQILEQQKNGDVFNEFTGRFKKLDPFGNIHEVDLNWTRDSVAKAQEKIEGFLNRIRDWLYDPATANSPDRPYWQDQHDFVDAVYNTAAVFNPPNVKSVIFRHSWTMPEFFYRQAELPAAKVSQTAFENWHRAWLQGTQWSQATEQPLIHTLQRAARKHGFTPSLGLQEYREKILNPLAWEYRHGRAVKAGDTIMGYRIEPEDIAAMRQMGSAISDIFNKQKNIGAERVMSPGWLYDEWASGVFAIRRPAEFAAAPGMTLPHEFSQAARTLAARVGEEIGTTDYAKLTDLFNGDLYFEPFVMRWLAQRSPDFSTPTPFEPLFKEIVAKWNAKEADAPRTVEEIIDFIDRNTDETYDADGITQAVVGGMANELNAFYKRFVKRDPNDFADIRVVRATKEGPFTTGFQKDVGSSFYYDYGMINAQEVRSMAIDSGMYHMMRFANSLSALEQEYGRALRDLAETKGRPELRRKLMESNRKLWRDGADFRDYDRLMAQLNEVKYFRTRLPIFSGRDVAVYEGLRNVYRLIGNSVLRTLSGWATMARVLTGSIAKQGFVFAAAERVYALSFPKAAASMALSTWNIGVVGTAKVVPKIPPWMVGKIAQKLSGREIEFFNRFNPIYGSFTEDIFRNGKYFNQQYDFGLGTKTPVLDTMYNDLTMPYTHGRGYDPHLSENAGLRMVQKGGYRLLSLLETGLEPVRVIFPTLGYSIAYDSVARQMYWRIKAMEAQARRTFDAHEKTGQLGKFDLDNPKSVKNIFLPEYVLPRGLLPKTATQLNLIREMFKRGTDIDLQDAVFTFWSRLAKAAPEERKGIHLLSADAPPADAARIERNRSGALASVGLFDIHHASPANRMWALRAGAVGRIMFPIAGWTVQSTRQWFAILGRAAHDPKLRPAVLTAMTGVTVLAALGMLGLSGDLEKRAFEELKWVLDKKVDPVRHFGQGRDAKENVQIAISDMTAYITTVANMFDAVLGEQSNRMSTIENVFPTEKIKSLLTYVNGVVHTHDPTYGLASFASREMPLLRPIVNRLPGQEGIVAEQNIRTIIQRFAPPELLRQTTGSYGMPTPTELSPIKQQLANAIYKKDWIGVIEAYDKFRAKAAELGRPEPDRLAANVMRSLNPYSMALVGHPTEAQRQAILDRLPEDQRQMLLDAETGYMAAAQSVGVQSEMVRKEPGTPGERAAAPAGGGGRVSLPLGGAAGGGGAIRTPSVGAGRVGMGRRISLGRGSGASRVGGVGRTRAAHYVSGKLATGSRRSRRLSYASLVGRGIRAGRKFSIRRPKARRVRRVRLYA